VQLRTVESADQEKLATFFSKIPERDRTFFKEDVLDPAVVASWTHPSDRQEHLIAVENGEVAGYVAIQGGVGWSRHVGDLRLVVAPARRRQGLGRRLAQRAMVDAFHRDYSKLTVDLVSEQSGAIRMFEELGFQPEALLIDHVRDRSGELQDLIVLAHHAREVWEDLASVGIDSELG
jgi:ribosomal protein S18 acetylase RimI-like enzyme